MKDAQTQFIQGTLELLILRTLIYGPAHGHAIAKHIQSSSETLRIETGSLYPALHRLEAQDLVRPENALAGCLLSNPATATPVVDGERVSACFVQAGA